ncbi:endonuclease/exonuclease/phosphatase family protein [Streptomyces tauricus]|uniref:Endonuclease/exonuclease/phosphatase family protein n=1 Tax=Streptomyces tauricus TaxID=68274 RepID=A0ABZ1JRM4_9ACTN|nr:endonuclease/exonuclease/phosphatase family protein [Streptomyces tauricus]
MDAHVGEAIVFTRRIRLLAGALVLGCLVLVGPSGPIDGPFASSLRDEITAEVVPNRVMTWNICNPCGENSADRAAEIATYAPQVIGMQEACVRDVERVRDYLKSRYGLIYHVEYGTVLRNWGRCGGLPWSPGAYGQAVLSAAPMTDLVHREYPDGGSEDRGYMAVTTTVGGQPVRVFNTHLAQRRQEAVRAAQTDVLAAEIAPYDRAIVIGDFNAVANAPELGAMWKLATDVDAECQPSSFSGGCKPTTDWQSKFDYIFLRGISPLKHRVHPTRYSDHHMLYSDLDMSTAREGS